MTPIERGGGGGGGTSAGGLIKLFDSTLGANAASIDTGAGGIAAGHGDLMVMITGRCAAAGDNVLLRINNDSGTNFDWVWLRALPAGPAIASAFNQTALTVCQFPGNADVAGLCGEATLHFPTYDGTTFDKTGDGTGGAVKTAVDFTTQFESLQWKSTAAITRMSIFLAGAGNLLAGSRMVIYGCQ